MYFIVVIVCCQSQQQNNPINNCQKEPEADSGNQSPTNIYH